MRLTSGYGLSVTNRETYEIFINIGTLLLCMTARRTDLEDEEINKLYMQGMNLKQLAKRYNCGENTIYRRLQERRPTKPLKDSYNWQHRLDMELNRQKVLSENDQKLILDFLEDCKSERVGKPRLIFYARLLRMTKQWRSKDLIDMDKQDIKRTLNKMEETDLAEYTKQGYRITFKKFFRWVAIEKKGEKLRDKEYPDIVSWIDTTIKAKDKVKPENLLDEKDVKKLIEVADTPRNKAIIALFWDSGCRCGELLNLKLKNLNFDKYGATVSVQGKTGFRKVRLIPSVPYLATLKENHPDKSNPQAFLFVGEGTRNMAQRLGYNAIDTLLRKLKTRAKISKRIHAHAFRHARASFLASRVKEPVMKELFGWTQRSQMVATYVHLSGRDIDREKMKADGIEIKEEKQKDSELEPKKCVRCGTMNTATASYCMKCSMILDEKVAKEIDKKKEIARDVWNKMATGEQITISKDMVKEVLRDMIKKGEIKV